MSHRCQNCIFTCIDFRFGAMHQKFTDALGASDRIALAGSAKSIVDADTRKSALKQIDLSRALHFTTTIYLIDHEDCGAYGGKGAVASDAEEIALHARTSHIARDIIIQKYPSLKVISKYIQLDGTIIDL